MEGKPISDEVGGRPPAGGPGDHWDDDDIWSEPEVSQGPPPRRGPSTPPRRGEPRRPAADGVAYPGDHGAVPGGPTTRSVPVAIAGGPLPDDGYEYEDLPGEGRLPRWLGVLVVLTLLVGTVVGGTWWWYNRQINPPGSPGETVSVEVPQGASTSGIGAILDREGIIPSAMVFNFYASRKDTGTFEAGVYRLRQNSDLDLVLATMAKGPSAAASAEVARVSIPEGRTITELLALVADRVPRLSAEKLQAALDDSSVATMLRPDGQKSYEGLLFPATYEVAGKTSAGELLAQLAGEMETRVNGLDADAAKARIKERHGLDLSTYELLTVASLVQAEAANAEEAPKIATVIYNRLAKDSTEWPLGIDASDAYGAEIEGVEVSAYRKTDGAYNTRRGKGLPPTPISAPGDYALEAAFDPAPGDWMYYVLTDAKAHTFAVTEAEFHAAKQICVQKNLGCG